MARTFTYLTELGVGLACGVAAVVSWRRRLRWPAAGLALAGAAAGAHAVVSLV